MFWRIKSNTVVRFGNSHCKNAIVKTVHASAHIYHHLSSPWSALFNVPVALSAHWNFGQLKPQWSPLPPGLWYWMDKGNVGSIPFREIVRPGNSQALIVASDLHKPWLELDVSCRPAAMCTGTGAYALINSNWLQQYSVSTSAVCVLVCVVDNELLCLPERVRAHWVY